MEQQHAALPRVPLLPRGWREAPGPQEPSALVRTVSRNTQATGNVSSGPGLRLLSVNERRPSPHALPFLATIDLPTSRGKAVRNLKGAVGTLLGA